MSCSSKNSKINAQSSDSVLSISSLETNKDKTYDNLDFAKTSIIDDTSNCEIIDRTIAIMILPDTTWINNQQKELGEDGWNEVVADNEYYQSQATDTLEKIGIEVKFFKTKKRYFKFIKKDKSEYCIDNLKMKDRWGLILFSVDKDPVYWSDTMIDDAIKEIFNK